MPKKRGTRSGLRREFRVVRATALRKLRGSEVDLSKHDLEVLAQLIRADLDRIDDGTGTASSSHTAGATAHVCRGGHGQATHAGNPTERSTAGRDETNIDGAQHEGIEAGSGLVRVSGPKDPPQGATLRRASDVVENLRVPMENRPRHSGQVVSRASGQNRRPHQRRSQRRSGPRESGTERAVVLCSGPCDATRECGGVDREEREPRGRCRGVETDSGRVRLDRARKSSRHVVQVGRSSVPPRAQTIVVGINKMEEGMTRCHKMAGGNLSDTIKRGILMKALTNEAELQKHVFRNSTRHSTYEKMREEVMSALTAERAVHELVEDDPMEIGAVGKSGKKGTGKKGKGKNDQKGRGKGPGQGKGRGTQNLHADRECFYCHRKGHIKEECRIRVADERDSKNKDEKDKRKDKRFRQKENKRVNLLEGRGQGNQGTSSSTPSQGEVQATVGALQARMIFTVRPTHGSTVSSNEVADVDILSERMRIAPLQNALMLDSGAQVSAVPRQQIDEMHFNPGPSNVTGLNGISGEDIPKYGHVELTLRRGQDVVQVGAEVADMGSVQRMRLSKEVEVFCTARQVTGLWTEPWNPHHRRLQSSWGRNKPITTLSSMRS